MLGNRALAKWALTALLPWAATAVADPTPGEQAADHQFFEAKIRPILIAKCQECHGEDKSSGELRLDSLQGMIDGGESGPAVVPGEPAESLLIQAVNYESLEMPPTGKLDNEAITLLTEWIQRGAPWPNAGPVRMPPKEKESVITDEDRAWWSFRPAVRWAPPVTTSRWPGVGLEGPIDSFLAEGWNRSGLAPSQPADARSLLRRVTYDLTGLPPELGELDAFVADERPDAYQRQVDRLLASPRFGERWGRHWLDVVRFAQSNGYERDAEKPFAWRYRDYVINALNEDKPYDDFIREQIAGDEMVPARDEAIVATGFHRLGVWDDEPDDKQNATFEALDDMVSTTGTAVLGLTVGCARCHDHKFDPIPQEDYYGLVAFFRNVKEYEKHDPNKKDHTMLVQLSNGEEALAVRENGPAAPPTHVLIRGDARSPGSEVAPSFLAVLSDSSTVQLPEPAADAKSCGRRTELAHWLTRPDHPLTARVIVNRLWHHHFGQGIVPTPSDFGKTGMTPSHPELLDWLARELADDDWRLKRIHRLMVESAGYRQSSQVTQPNGLEVDPDNRLVWRQSMRRLEAESMRDSVLAASGQLNLEMGGRGFFPALSQEVLSTQSRPGDGWGSSTLDQQARRSVYTFIKRTLRAPVLETFDAASPDQPIAARTVTTIAPQALVWLNSTFMDEESLAMADRLLHEHPGALDAQIERLYRLAYQRPPTDEERQRARAFVESQRKGWRNLESTPPEVPALPASPSLTDVAGVRDFFSGLHARRHQMRESAEWQAARADAERRVERRALASLCAVVFNANEFVYVD